MERYSAIHVLPIEGEPCRLQCVLLCFLCKSRSIIQLTRRPYSRAQQEFSVVTSFEKALTMSELGRLEEYKSFPYSFLVFEEVSNCQRVLAESYFWA